ncbi:nuclear transport factor 2 family protein [Nocardia sp. NBC_00416]|uniref:nuclear transport factor 2 family protein n=1 Tax=Nocardia sp. NBC_00416 TaxID=2975991 RepID=UPI002E2352DB
MAAPDDIRSAVRRYLATVADGSAKEIAALYAEDATVEDPVGTPAHQGRAAIEKFYGALESVRTTTELLDIRVAGDNAAFGFRVVTDTGDRTLTIEPIDVMTFDDDARITSMRAYWSPDDIALG